MFGYDLQECGQYLPEDDVFYSSAVLKKDTNYSKENYSLCTFTDNNFENTIFFIGGFTLKCNEIYSNNFMLVPKYEYVEENNVWIVNFFKEWYEIPQLNTPRSSCSTFICKGFLFVIYGEGNVDKCQNRNKGHKKSIDLIEFAPIQEFE